MRNKAKKSFWSVFVFYFLVAFEFAYMAGPFAIYFYSVYSPVLNCLNKNPVTAWLIKFFLPHVSRQVSNPIIKWVEIVGIILSVVGFLIFIIGACQIYYSKLRKRGAVLGGLYKYVRHPQYTSFIVCSFGLLLLWPRYIVIVFFVTLVFAYVFLARAEERECEEKFGESYIQYKEKTGRFFPKVMGKDNREGSRGKKIAKNVAAYIVTLAIFFGAALGLNYLGIRSLYADYTNEGVTVSLCKMENGTIEEAVAIAKRDNRVQQYLKKQSIDTELNYILPTEWFAAEIPMNGVTYRSGHSSTENYNHNKYKIIFTEAKFRGDSKVRGMSILYNTMGMNPIVEVWVDIQKGQVTDVKHMPASIKYDGIPVAIY